MSHFKQSSSSGARNQGQRPGVAPFRKLAPNSRASLRASKESQLKERVFVVVAGEQCDIYYMHHRNPHPLSSKGEYFDTAYIPSYKVSVWMNSLFRGWRECTRLDAIEESDDDEELNSSEYSTPPVYIMKCRYNQRFKKWIPFQVLITPEPMSHKN